MRRDKLDRKLAEFDRLYKNFYEKSFELKKTEVLRIEQEIRNIVGNDPDYLNCEVLRDRKEDLVFLLDSRRTLLNWMYQETDEEVARMEIVNSRLFNLTKRLRVKMADVCESVAQGQEMILMTILMSKALCILATMGKTLCFHTLAQMFMEVTTG